MNPGDKYALATVTTENYVQWTMVMIYSFLKSNPWFTGDFVIISDNLSEKSLSGLSLFPRIVIEKPSETLSKKLAELCAELPDFSKRISRFYSMEVFRLKHYDKILFLDSDMIVVKNVIELFGLPGDIYASHEWFSGKGRRMSDFEIAQSTVDNEDYIENPVNSGFMMINKGLLLKGIYENIVNSIQAKHWENTKTQLTDQLIINKFFNNKITIIDARYNYRPKNAEGILKKEKIQMEDAKIIHFMLKAKPWNLNEVFKTADQKLDLLKGYEIWYKWFFDFLTWFHLQQKVKIMTSN